MTARPGQCGTSILGSLSANVTPGVQAWAGAATLVGSGSLSPNPYISARIIVSWAEFETTAVLSSATLAGIGNLSALARLRQTIAVDWDGAGNLSASLRQGHRAAATFAGSGNLSANTTQRQTAGARFAGAGNLSVDLAPPPKLGAATLGGAGTLSAQAYLSVRVIVSWAELETTAVLSAATLAGVGNLSANATVVTGGAVQQINVCLSPYA